MQSICTVCGYVGHPKNNIKGSFFIEIVLWLFFLLPGLIYTAWRLNSKAGVCPACGKDTLIPINTPMGQKLIKDHQIVGIELENKPVRKNPKSIKTFIIIAVLIFPFLMIVGAGFSALYALPIPSVLIFITLVFIGGCLWKFKKNKLMSFWKKINKA